MDQCGLSVSILSEHSHYAEGRSFLETGASSPVAHDPEKFEKNKRHCDLGFASPLAGVLVLANTLLGGSGMLAIPHAVSVAGYGLGLCFVALFGACSALGCHLLACAARKIGTAPCTFYSTSNAVAPNWTWLIDAAVMIKCFGVGTSYLIIVGDLLPNALNHLWHLGVSRTLGVVLGFAIAGPLAFFPTLSALRYTAFGAVLIAIWTTILVCLFYSEAFDPCVATSSSNDPLPCNGASVVPVGNQVLKMGKVLPVFIFGFTCQQNIFTVCNEVRNTSMKRVNMVIAPAYTVAAVSFAITALLGYLTYGDKIATDMLKTYPETTVVSVSRLLFAFMVMFSYPLQAHPSRLSAFALYRQVKSRLDPQFSRDTPTLSWPMFLLISVIWTSASFAIALVVEDLGVVLSIVGATGSTMVTYILPGLLYMRTFEYPHLKRKIAFVQLVLGLIIMPTCLVMIFV